MIEIDGSTGEGGGQIVRTSLTLSLLTGQPFRICGIRAGRTVPGLRAQHMTSVEAAAAISNAAVQGAEIGSSELRFFPGQIHGGNFRFDVGTAGSTSLVLQTILLPLGRADKRSSITVLGGTHVPWSPTFHYLDWQWIPHLRRLGIEAYLTAEQMGFYPAGGGRVEALIHPTERPQPIDLTRRGRLHRITGLSAVANLDEEIARRQKLQALRRLQPFCRDTKIRTDTLPSPTRGTFIVALAEYEGGRLCASAIGAPGKPAEAVADEAAESLLRAMGIADATVDEHLADQLLVPLALADGISRFHTSRVTRHLLTNAALVCRFLPVQIKISGDLGKPGLVEMVPSDLG